MKYRERKRKKIARRYIFLVGTVICVAVFGLSMNLVAGSSAESRRDTGAAENPDSASGRLIRSNERVSMEKIAVEEIYDTGFLRIVDTKHKLDSDQWETVSAFQVIPLSNREIRVNEEALKALEKMLTGAKKDEIGDFVITSGYRTADRQRELYSAEPDSGLVAEPMASEHQTGLAVDFATMSASRADFSKTRQGEWAAENAHKFGFILSYPEHSESVTGIRPETWHYRYVGLPHSLVIAKKGSTLNEYIDLIEPDTLYTVEDARGSWRVYRTVPKKGKILVPKDHSAISADGEGGYVVTTKVK